MIGKSLIAAAAVATTLTAALPASSAKADVDVNIGIGVGRGYAPGYPAYGGYYGYGGYRGGYGYWRHEPRRMSCYRGANIVDDAGFYRVNPIDCGGASYAYTAWKHDHKFVVRVNSYGAITSARRIF